MRQPVVVPPPVTATAGPQTYSASPAVRAVVLLVGAGLAAAATPSSGAIAVAVAALWAGLVTPGAWCLARRRVPGRPVLGHVAVSVDVLGLVAILAVSGGTESPVRWLLACTPLLAVHSNPRCLPTVVACGGAGYAAILVGEVALGADVHRHTAAAFFGVYVAVAAVAWRMRRLRSSERRLLRSLRRVRRDAVDEGLTKERRTAEALVARLHDGPLQLMFSVAQDLADHLHGDPVDLARSRGRLLDAVAEIRALNEARFQSVLSDAGLAGALREAASEVEGRGGPPVTVSVGGGTGGAHDATVIATTKELLTNVAKHARAHDVSVAVARDAEGRLRVTVTDDGVGVATAGRLPTARPGHTGLRFLAQHVAGLGGAISVVDLRPGTRIEVVLPVAGEAPAGPGPPGGPPARRPGRPRVRWAGPGLVAALFGRGRVAR